MELPWGKYGNFEAWQEAMRRKQPDKAEDVKQRVESLEKRITVIEDRIVKAEQNMTRLPSIMEELEDVKGALSSIKIERERKTFKEEKCFTHHKQIKNLWRAVKDIRNEMYEIKDGISREERKRKGKTKMKCELCDNVFFSSAKKPRCTSCDSSKVVAVAGETAT
jgi:chromosome segregation ATPase